MPPSALSSFDRWFDAYAPSLVLYARQWLDGSAAEDAVQEVFIQLLQQRHAPPNVRAWLYRGVRQKALSAGQPRQKVEAMDQYHADGRSAVLESPSPDPHTPYLGRRYELTFAN